jgi:rod shape-determining protein MreC
VSERRTAWLLAAVLSAQLVLVSVQAPAASGGGANLLEESVLRGVAPLTAMVDAVAGGFGRAGEGLRRQSSLVAENRELRAEAERLRLELMRLSAAEDDLGRLARALAYEPLPPGKISVADVVYADHASWLKTLVVHTGRAPVAVNQPVVDGAGLVGRVVLVSPPYAKVQLLTDRSAAVGAMLRRSRRQGVVRSGPDGLTLDFLPRHTPVEVGEAVVTSGTDGIYPRGLPVGTVAAVEPGSELFHLVRLEPAVDFTALDQVYLLGRSPAGAPP